MAPMLDYFELLERCNAIANQRRDTRKMRLYFDSNDEFVNEGSVPELLDLNKAIVMGDDSDDAEERLTDAYSTVQMRYHQVLVDFGSEQEQVGGTTRITRDLLTGKDKTENALLFVENLNKITRVKKPAAPVVQLKPCGNSSISDGLEGCEDNTTVTEDFLSLPPCLGNEPASYDSNSDVDESAAVPVESGVILNISAKKFEKPKDQLFIDFFGMYTGHFAKDGKKPAVRKQQKSRSIKLEGLGQNKKPALPVLTTMAPERP